MQVKLKLPIKIYCDNQAAIANIKNVGATARTRHYENWLTYGREQFLSRISHPEWIGTLEQVADIFTKALDKTTSLKFRAALLNLYHDAVTDYMRGIISGHDVS